MAFRSQRAESSFSTRGDIGAAMAGRPLGERGDIRGAMAGKASERGWRYLGGGGGGGGGHSYQAAGWERLVPAFALSARSGTVLCCMSTEY